MKKRALTMADLVAQESRRPVRDVAAPLVPGSRNRDDVMATPDGERMAYVRGLEPDEAAAAITRGALVVWGHCGCGPTDCGRLDWLEPGETKGRVPELHGKGPGWLDLWRSATHEVVFGHGEVRWIRPAPTRP